mgnify:CR=1 FL=1
MAVDTFCREWEDFNIKHEEEYKKKPNDATVILQLIESSHVSKKERYEKALLGMNFIASLNKNSGDFKHIAPAIARKALQHAVEDDFSQTEEWFKWTKGRPIE